MFEPINSPPTIAAATVNGGPKRYKPKQPPLTVHAGCTCFRLLCHASRIGGVIGKSGVIIKQLQQETSAKIRVEDPPPDSDDRVITVIANSAANKTISFIEHNNQLNKNLDEGSEYSEVSAAQEALVKVFERILLVAAEADGGYFAPGGVASCRLLADKSVIGSVIGKGGKVIEKIRKDTGCRVRILVQDKLPSCALPTDEMVEIEGDILAIKKALIAVTRCIQDCSHAQSQKTRAVVGRTHPTAPWDLIPNGISNSHTHTHSHSDFDLPPPRSQGQAFHLHPHPPTSKDADLESQKEIVFRILYSSDKVGSLIGKSGTIIQAIQNESGAHIAIGAPVSDCDERLITISAMESAESRKSAAQNAVILVFNRSVESGFQKGMDMASSGAQVSARLVISQNQMGCLLGKGGSIVADMRKVTGAFIKIVGDHQVPKCAPETDQVVLMTGEMINVRDALYSVTGRLRNNLFSNKMSNSHGTGTTKGTYTHHQSSVATSHYPPNQHNTNLTQTMDNLKLSSSSISIDRPVTPGQWHLPMGHDISTGSTSVGRSAIVSNMSVEILVSQTVIALVYGENGSNLTRLRQISGAKVVVHEPRSGTSDHIVVISGTPNETQSAQSLLQAFILADQS
ncbi:KH domain-containing protein HEN4 [Lactuca sativa]|uniref:KH domain-containing protein HEN4 n=1 Tax=Lactuca sativa TaxID=4236 RepID=UPI000CB10466|nr:KH domain-containing protein HEN4 [Lactuca sativa]